MRKAFAIPLALAVFMVLFWGASLETKLPTTDIRERGEIPATPPIVTMIETGGLDEPRAGQLVHSAWLGNGTVAKDPPPWSSVQPARTPLSTDSIRILIDSDAPPDRMLIGFLVPGTEDIQNMIECIPDPDDTSWLIEVGTVPVDCLIGRDSRSDPWFVDIPVDEDFDTVSITVAAIWHPLGPSTPPGGTGRMSFTCSWIFALDRSMVVHGA
jgi:hypothetical protein